MVYFTSLNELFKFLYWSISSQWLETDSTNLGKFGSLEYENLPQDKVGYWLVIELIRRLAKHKLKHTSVERYDPSW